MRQERSQTIINSQLGGEFVENQKSNVTEIGDDVYLWLEQDSSIMIKAISKHGDPVELTAEEALKLAMVLEQLAKKIKD